MKVPLRGTLEWQAAEFTVRWRQLGRAVAKQAPILGLLGRAFARLPLIRHTYGWSDKTLGR